MLLWPRLRRRLHRLVHLLSPDHHRPVTHFPLTPVGAPTHGRAVMIACTCGKVFWSVGDRGSNAVRPDAAER